jgi:hypothetical protein
MLGTSEAMSLLPIMEIVGPILLGVALVYGAVQWSRRRGGRIDAMRQAATRNLYREGAQEERLEHGLVPADVAAVRQTAERTPTARVPNPKIEGKLRSGRQGDRPSEDDIVRQHMGPRGVAGESVRANALRESETQIPKALDPGHTA